MGAFCNECPERFLLWCSVLIDLLQIVLLKKKLLG